MEQPRHMVSHPNSLVFNSIFRTNKNDSLSGDQVNIEYGGLARCGYKPLPKKDTCIVS